MTDTTSALSTCLPVDIGPSRLASKVHPAQRKTSGRGGSGPSFNKSGPASAWGAEGRSKCRGRWATGNCWASKLVRGGEWVNVIPPGDTPPGAGSRVVAPVTLPPRYFLPLPPSPCSNSPMQSPLAQVAQNTAAATAAAPQNWAGVATRTLYSGSKKLVLHRF